MVQRFQTNLKRKLYWRIASSATWALATAVLAVSIDPAGARTDRGQSRAAGKPMMAIVALSDQRISVYDANGRILQAPVSTGSTGYETPAGIFSIVQKKEVHSSNLYQDGEMPFMQRITWTGIALHAGALPGHPASHGCIRLPMAFAQQLFSLTDLGMRVLLVRDDMAPSDIAHPALFKSGPVRKDLALAALRGDRSFTSNAAAGTRVGVSAPDADVAPGSARHLQILQSLAAARAADSEAAAKRDREARQMAAKRTSDAASATRSLRAVEANFAKAEAALKDAERRLETATSSAATSPQVRQQAETAKTKAVVRVGEFQAQLQTVRLQERAKREAAERATDEASAAAAARGSAAQMADEAARKTSPVSVFISRKTQRLYVRKANYPIYEGPVTIRDAQMPIGTFIFTALNPLDTSGEMRWSVVAMYRNPTNIESSPQGKARRASARNANAPPTDVAAASAALDRVAFVQEALDVISQVVLPGSSLIISDEGPSRETGKDTDFVVVISGEPQGALKVRQREPVPMDGFRQSPFRSLPFFWN
jgi:L,D-transpeptidase catalytic domain